MKEEAPQPDNAITTIIERFRQRAARLTRSATVVIIIIVSILIAGITVFILAGTIANRESNTAQLKDRRDLLAELEVELRVKTDAISKLDAEKTRLESQLNAELSGTGRSGRYGAGPRYDDMRQQLDQLKDNLEIANTRQGVLEHRKQVVLEDIAKLEGPNPTSTLDQNQVSVMVSAIATRVGSIVLLLFLVQILVPMYRYNTRLASYYEARADALELISHNSSYDLCGDVLDRITGIFSPDSVDFGKPPSSPADQAIELAKYILSHKDKT